MFNFQRISNILSGQLYAPDIGYRRDNTIGQEVILTNHNTESNREIDISPKACGRIVE